VQTPSKSPRYTLISGVDSKAVTIGISVVPGLAKQTSMPDETAVLTSRSAPFTIYLPAFYMKYLELARKNSFSLSFAVVKIPSWTSMMMNGPPMNSVRPHRNADSYGITAP
jgi:hypothetical protein